MSWKDGEMTLRELAEGLASGELRIAPEHTTLTVPALASGDGAACYPSTRLYIMRGDLEIAEVSCWVYGHYMKGPNRSDNGEYIGAGWVWQVDESDGATTGRPRCRADDLRRTVVIETSDGAGTSLVVDIDDDLQDDHPEAGRLIDDVQDAVDAAYRKIKCSPADDDDVLEALQDRRQVAEISVELPTGDDATVGLYAGWDAGRTVYTHQGAMPGCSQAFEDAAECVADAENWLRGILRAAADGEIDIGGKAALLAESLAD